ncbi:MAG: PEP-CTERM sorting domain-containing protein [Colwellia sp.]|nr:PEP-CTERM sorting domain-containing protein [Colwellia sp.]
MYKIVVLVLAFLVSNTSQANFISVIDFTGNNEGVEQSFDFAIDGVSVNVSAWNVNVNDNQEFENSWHQVDSNYGVYKGRTGLGVKSNEKDGVDLDGGLKESFSRDPDEGLLFEFSELVNFYGFFASELGSDDDINLSLVEFISPGVIKTTDIFVDIGSSENEDLFGIFPGVQGLAFMVWVDGKTDDVRIDDIGFTRVPEPSTLWLFALAIISITVRKKA